MIPRCEKDIHVVDVQRVEEEETAKENWNDRLVFLQEKHLQCYKICVRQLYLCVFE